jgi:hypothetical protein
VSARISIVNGKSSEGLISFSLTFAFPVKKYVIELAFAVFSTPKNNRTYKCQ